MTRMKKEPRRKVEDWDGFVEHLESGGSFRFWYCESNPQNRLYRTRAVVDGIKVVARSYSYSLRGWSYALMDLYMLREHFKRGHLYWP